MKKAVLYGAYNQFNSIPLPTELVKSKPKLIELHVRHAVSHLTQAFELANKKNKPTIGVALHSALNLQCILTVKTIMLRRKRKARV